MEVRGSHPLFVAAAYTTYDLFAQIPQFAAHFNEPSSKWGEFSMYWAQDVFSPYNPQQVVATISLKQLYIGVSNYHVVG